jgi:hypothetical protein
MGIASPGLDKQRLSLPRGKSRPASLAPPDNVWYEPFNEVWEVLTLSYDVPRLQAYCHRIRFVWLGDH